MDIEKIENQIEKRLDAIAENWYLEFFNNFLTVKAFANHKGVSEKAANSVLMNGKKIYNDKFKA